MNGMKRTLSLGVAGIAAASLGAAALGGCGTGGAAPTDPSGGLSGAGVARSAPRLEETAPVKAADPLWETRRIALRLTATGKAPGIDRVYATIHRVELLGGAQGETTVAAFQDDSGAVVDLASLSGKLLPLSAPAVSSAQTITRVRIALGPGLMRFAAGSATGEQVLLSETLPRDAAGRPTVLVTLARPIDSASAGSLTLSVDLGKLESTGEKSSISLSASGDSKGEAIEREISGTVRGVAGEIPTQRMLIGGELVRLSAATALVGENPKLAEGQSVRVRIALESGAFVARRIVLGEDGSVLIRGKVKSVDAAAGTLTLAIDEVDGALVSQNTVGVTLTEGALLRRQSGLRLDRAALLQAATPGTVLSVEGGYEPVTGALAARRVFVEDGGPSVVSLTAPIAAADERSLTVGPPSAWDGFAPPEKGLTLSLQETTALIGDDGAALKPAAFALAAKERSVRAIGVLSKDGKVTASRLELAPKAAATPAPEPKPTEADKKPASEEPVPEKTEKKDVVQP